MSLNMPANGVLQASCPSRVDIGNTLDFPSHFFSLPNRSARTANIAIELRTKAMWWPDRPGRITLIGNSVTEEHQGLLDPRKSRFPILCIILSHFGITSGRFRIVTDIPRGSGLGGSGALITAFMALAKTLVEGRVAQKDWAGLLVLAHLFENWLGFSKAGFQDQLAGLYGGANLWTWGSHFDHPIPFVERRPVVPPAGLERLREHMALAFTGEPHGKIESASGFLPIAGRDMTRWSGVSDRTLEFVNALERGDWNQAALHLNAECGMREELNPDCITKRARGLLDLARACGAGARYTGNGGGGCVWAFGEREAMCQVFDKWQKIVCAWDGAWVLQPRIALEGLRILG